MRNLALSLVLLVLVSMLGLGWALDGLFEHFSDQPGNDSLAAYKEVGTVLARTLDLNENPQNLLPALDSNDQLLISLQSENEFLLPDQLKPGFIAGTPLALESDEGITLNFYLPKSQQVLSLASPEMLIQEDKSPLSLIFTVLFYFGMLALILLWLYPLVKRLINLRKTAKALGKGDLAQRVEMNSISYISDIENEFNRMAQRIQMLVSDNKLLSSAVSHDLRTPLARLRFGIDALEEEGDPKVREKYQQRISNDLTEMESLVETLLNYARIDQAMINLEKLPVALNALVHDSIHSAKKEGKKIKAELTCKNSSVLGDKRYLSMLVNNLLQNALRHAKNEVYVALKVIGGFCELSISDDGEGIPETERNEVTKPFIRGNNSAGSQGYGMGLAISQRIADWHRGKLNISESKILGGAEIRVRFPLSI